MQRQNLHLFLLLVLQELKIGRVQVILTDGLGQDADDGTLGRKGLSHHHEAMSDLEHLEEFPQLLGQVVVQGQTLLLCLLLNAGQESLVEEHLGTRAGEQVGHDVHEQRHVLVGELRHCDVDDRLEHQLALVLLDVLPLQVACRR